MFRSEYGYQADELAARAARAPTEDERQVLLKQAKLLRQFAEADRRIHQVRARNPDIFTPDEPANDDTSADAAAPPAAAKR